MEAAESLANRACAVASTQLDLAETGATLGADPGEEERELLEAIAVEDTMAEQAAAREQYEALKADEELEDEFAWQAKEDAEIAEAEAREAASEASTQKLAAEDQQKWDDWAVASELGLASVPKRQRVSVRVSAMAELGTTSVVDLGSVPVGQPLHLTLALAMDTMPGESGSASSTEPVKLSGAQLVPFLESNLGATVFDWWRKGLVPSVLIKKELGADVLEAFQAQRSFLESGVDKQHTGS